MAGKRAAHRASRFTSDYAGHGNAVCTLRICAAIGFGIGNHIARCRTISARSYPVSVGNGGRCVIGNRDYKTAIGNIAVAIGHDYGKAIGGRIAQRVVGQDIAIAVNAFGQRHCQRSRSADDGTASGNIDAVDHHRANAVIASADNERARRSF